MPRARREVSTDEPIRKHNRWFDISSKCVHCGGDDFSSERLAPRTFILCSECQNMGTHVECYEAATGTTITEEFIDGGAEYFCSEGCQQIHNYLRSIRLQRLPIKGESQNFSLEVVKYNNSCRPSKSAVEAALKVFKSSFDPLVMDNSRDLLEMVCTAYETPEEGADEEEELYNFSAFLVLVLRKGSTIVTAATLRFFGTQFAELPFVATRDGYRREGNCKRLMKAVDELLQHLKVQYLVLPSIRSVLPMWTRKFLFTALTHEEEDHLSDHIVSPDTTSCQLIKKAITNIRPIALERPVRKRGRPRKSGMKKEKLVRRGGRANAEENADTDTEDREGSGDDEASDYCPSKRSRKAREERPALQDITNCSNLNQSLSSGRCHKSTCEPKHGICEKQQNQGLSGSTFQSTTTHAENVGTILKDDVDTLKPSDVQLLPASAPITTSCTVETCQPAGNQDGLTYTKPIAENHPTRDSEQPHAQVAQISQPTGDKQTPPPKRKRRPRTTTGKPAGGLDPALKTRANAMGGPGRGCQIPVPPGLVKARDRRLRIRQARMARRAVQRDVMLGYCLADAVHAFMTEFMAQLILENENQKNRIKQLQAEKEKLEEQLSCLKPMSEVTEVADWHQELGCLCHDGDGCHPCPSHTQTHYHSGGLALLPAPPEVPRCPGSLSLSALESNLVDTSPCKETGGAEFAAAIEVPVNTDAARGHLRKRGLGAAHHATKTSDRGAYWNMLHGLPKPKQAEKYAVPLVNEVKEAAMATGRVYIRPDGTEAATCEAPQTVPLMQRKEACIMRVHDPSQHSPRSPLANAQHAMVTTAVQGSTSPRGSPSHQAMSPQPRLINQQAATSPGRTTSHVAPTHPNRSPTPPSSSDTQSAPTPPRCPTSVFLTNSRTLGQTPSWYLYGGTGAAGAGTQLSPTVEACLSALLPQVIGGLLSPSEDSSGGSRRKSLSGVVSARLDTPVPVALPSCTDASQQHHATLPTAEPAPDTLGGPPSLPNSEHIAMGCCHERPQHGGPPHLSGGEDHPILRPEEDGEGLGRHAVELDNVLPLLVLAQAGSLASSPHQENVRSPRGTQGHSRCLPLDQLAEVCRVLSYSSTSSHNGSASSGGSLLPSQPPQGSGASCAGSHSQSTGSISEVLRDIYEAVTQEMADMDSGASVGRRGTGQLLGGNTEERVEAALKGASQFSWLNDEV